MSDPPPGVVTNGRCKVAGPIDYYSVFLYILI